MTRPVWAISRLYLRSALRSPVTWLACVVALGYTAVLSPHTAARLANARIHLSVPEMVMYVLSDQWHITWGLLFCFLLIVSPMLYAKDRERFVAYRAGGRTELWAAKLLAILQLTVLFLGAVLLISLALIAPGRPLSALQWSPGYAEAVRTVASDPEQVADPIYRDVANPHLFETTSPLTASFLQAAVFLLAFVLVGALTAVLAQALPKHQGVTLIVMMVYLAMGVMPADIVPAAAQLLLPQMHVLPWVRTEQFPHAVSLLFLGSALTLLAVASWLQGRRSFLG